MTNQTNQTPGLGYLGLDRVGEVFYQLSPDQLVKEALKRNEGTLADSGALAIDTGEFTGRSPKDRFIVEDEVTRDAVWWSDINLKFSPAKFDALYNKVTSYLQGREVFVRDCAVCADEKYRMGIRVISETAYQNLFVHHLFMRPENPDANDHPDWTIIAVPGFIANATADGTRQHNFSIINFTKKIILIGGTGYTGEMKKGIFSVLNFVLPHDKHILSMHCSANIGANGDTAIFFGLSGTGKTTLSADPTRQLIGDDEHGWGQDGVFNFEGGCYAKCVDLSPEKEPQIYNAIRSGALLENINYFPGTKKVDFSNIDKTENTRVAYPLYNIDNAITPSKGGVPKNIFLLTADAFGVLPPISKLSAEQAMYYFISGYTAKVAGTEAGVNEPQATFAACFGEAFLPLNPAVYADLLGEQIEKNHVNVWLVNTGWTGGPYGTGKRIDLKYTRAMVNAALNGRLKDVYYRKQPVFNVLVPVTCPQVPGEVLDPRSTWADKAAYDEKANHLAALFNQNFKQYSSFCTHEVINAAPTPKQIAAMVA